MHLKIVGVIVSLIGCSIVAVVDYWLVVGITLMLWGDYLWRRA